MQLSPGFLRLLCLLLCYIWNYASVFVWFQFEDVDVVAAVEEAEVNPATSQVRAVPSGWGEQPSCLTAHHASLCSCVCVSVLTSSVCVCVWPPAGGADAGGASSQRGAQHSWQNHSPAHPALSSATAAAASTAATASSTAATESSTAAIAGEFPPRETLIFYQLQVANHQCCHSYLEKVIRYWLLITPLKKLI